MVDRGGEDYRYWNAIRSVWQFNKALNKVPRNYYLDIVKQYRAGNFLDLGCGFGETYNLFVRNGIKLRYVGMDVTRKFIDICKERYPEAEFMTGQMQDIPFPDESFDIVSCRCVLEHLPDPEPAIREMARVSAKAVVVVWFRWPGNVDRRKYKKDGYWLNDYQRDWVIGIADSSDLILANEMIEKHHLVWVLEHP